MSADQVPVEAEPDVGSSEGPDSAEPASVEDVEEAPADSRIEVARKALSRAEISRRQREKDPDGYKKANRERMRRKRGG